MLRSPISYATSNYTMFVRCMSNKGNPAKRFLQTGTLSTNNTPKDYVPYKLSTTFKQTSEKKQDATSSSWSKHALSSRSFGDIVKSSKNKNATSAKEEAKPTPLETYQEAEKDVSQTTTVSAAAPKKRRRTLKPRKALITLSPNAIVHLKGLLDQPEPKLIRIGVKNRGCSGLTYNLEYISEPQKFDEVVEQDGVKVVIDSKALFSIVGSEMEWLDDKLSSRFIFKNPNSKGTCGCGESFMV